VQITKLLIVQLRIYSGRHIPMVYPIIERLAETVALGEDISETRID
jgi:hypothetical protein